jgi:prephenate dehydrogenase
MNGLLFRKATIMGVGLIGASCALALKDSGLCETVAGYGRSERNLKEARELGMIDEYSLEARHACEKTDLVILSTPVSQFKDLIREIRGDLKGNAVITDVGSVKGALVHEIEELMPESVYYVGSHPIAGSEKSGFNHASANLFEKSQCIVTPTHRSNEIAVRKIISMWESFGASIEIMDPVLHDEVYAAVSHLPHLIAYTMMNTVDEGGAEYFRFAGPGFKDSTRIALSSPELWRDISLLNGSNLLLLIDRFRDNLDLLASLIKNSDASGLEREFSKARSLRQKIK